MPPRRPNVSPITCSGCTSVRHHIHDAPLVINAVDDTVVTNPDAVENARALELAVDPKAEVRSQGLDSRHDPCDN